MVLMDFAQVEAELDQEYEQKLKKWEDSQKAQPGRRKTKAPKRPDHAVEIMVSVNTVTTIHSVHKYNIMPLNSLQLTQSY